MSQYTNTSKEIDNHKKHYLLGFVLATILTLIPFIMVMSETGSRITLFLVITVCAVAQLIVQLVYFLHMGFALEQRWNLISFIFSAIVIILLVGLSIWIMLSLHANMMIS